MTIKRRLLHLFIALDQLLYVLITLGDGYPDETISSACWRLEQQGKFWGKFWRPKIDWLLSPIEKDHCRVAYWAERRQVQLPEEYRK